LANFQSIENVNLRNLIKEFDTYSKEVQGTLKPYSPRKFLKYRNNIVNTFSDYIRKYRKTAKRLSKQYDIILPKIERYIEQAEQNIISTFERQVQRAFGQAMHSLERELGEQLSSPGLFGVYGLLSFMKKKRLLTEKEKLEGLTRVKKNGQIYTIQIVPYLILLIVTAQAEILRKINENLAFGQGTDLVYISPHACWLGPQAKEVCNKWRDKIVSLTGMTPNFPTIKQATSERPPLFHPHCTHIINAMSVKAEQIAISRRIKNFSTLKQYL